MRSGVVWGLRSAPSLVWPAAGEPVVDRAELPHQPPLRPAKVLHVITRFIDGSGGNTLLSALGTDRQRYEPWVAGAPVGELWERAAEGGVRTVKLHRLGEVISLRDDLAILAQLVVLIRRERFTIVHTHSTKAGVLGRIAAWVCRTPVVVHTFHGFSVHPDLSSWQRRTYLAVERLIRPMTDAFIAVAPQVAREAVELRLSPPGAVRVLPSAVEPASPACDSATRAEFGVPDDAPLVGTVGRLDPQKAPLDFVRMAATVARAHPEARFVMVGEGELEGEVRAEARRLGVEIILAGHRADAAALASCFDVYVMTSRYEGLGRALTEALASGRPVVATAVNGVVDLVEPGVTGLLTSPGDPEATAACVRWMIEHPAAAMQMGAQGRVRTAGLFDPELMCTLIDATYDGLLGLPAPGGPVAALSRPPGTPGVAGIRQVSDREVCR